MGKEDEIRYLERMGAEEIRSVAGKPFSSPSCGEYLAEIAAVMTLLLPPPGKVLDLGCGAGWTSRFFARRGYDVTGVDLCGDMIACANKVREEHKLERLRFAVGDYETVQFDREFDAVVFLDSLHHAVDEDAAILAAYRALRPGGICVTSEPGRGHAKAQHSVEAVSRYNVTERDMPPGRVIRAGRKAGFRKVRVYPHASHVHAALYGDPDARFLEGRLSPGPLGSCVRWMLRRACFRGLVLLALTHLCRRYSGIVVLVK